MTKPEEISQYINQLSFDLKAELLVAVLMEQSEIPEIRAVFNGQHKRVWSKDIDCSTVGGKETGNDVLYIFLNRDGIYDLLPEAFFHGMHSDARSGEEMARESMKVRTEEKEARLFFQPFEHEIFMGGVQLAMMENQLYRNIYSELLTGMIPDFWKIKNDFPVNFVTKLKKILPAAYQVCGDLDLTAQCLEYVLNEKVNLSSSMKTPDYIEEGTAGSEIPVGSILGGDFVLGSYTTGFMGSLTFMIGPVKSRDNITLIKNGSMDRFLDCFYGYFIPVELDAGTKYIFSDEESIFTLNEEDEKSSHLAYNSVIQ